MKAGAGDLRAASALHFALMVSQNPKSFTVPSLSLSLSLSRFSFPRSVSDFGPRCGKEGKGFLLKKVQKVCLVMKMRWLP